MWSHMLSPRICVLWNSKYSFHVLHEMFCYDVFSTHLPLSWLLTKSLLSFPFVLALHTIHDWSVLSTSCCLFFYQKSFLLRNQWPEFMNTVWYMTGKILCCELRTGMQSWSAECSAEDAFFFFCFFPFFHLSHSHYHFAMKEVRTDIKKYSVTGFINQDLVLWFREVMSFQFDPRFKHTWVNYGSGQCSWWGLVVLQKVLRCAGKWSWESHEISLYF